MQGKYRFLLSRFSTLFLYPNIHIPVCPSPHVNCYIIPANSVSIEGQVSLQSHSGCLSQVSLPFLFNFLLPVSFFSPFYPPMSASHFAPSRFPLFSHTPPEMFLFPPFCLVVKGPLLVLLSSSKKSGKDTGETSCLPLLQFLG